MFEKVIGEENQNLTSTRAIIVRIVVELAQWLLTCTGNV